MFKLYHINKAGSKIEVLPENGIYIVYELYEYYFSYNGDIKEKAVFIEDEALDISLISYRYDKIELSSNKRIFENHFGYLTMLVNHECFDIEVRIQKLKVPELEEMLLYLWNQDPIIFDNFFSRSSVKSKLDTTNPKFNFSSKFIKIFEDYHIFFKTRYFAFKSLPHYVLRSRSVIQNYDDADISSNSIDWLINNLDQVHIDYLYKSTENSIRINNSHCIVEKILTEQKINDLNVYENQIILGSFDFVQELINEIKNIIKSNVPDIISYEKEYYSINEFRVIPFIKLKNDLEKIEAKIKSLKIKYQEIFSNSKSRNNFPKLTSVFSNKKHYTEAYNKIKLIRDIKFSLDGELRLLNIKKISTLYERFNLFVMVNSFLSKGPNKVQKSEISENGVFQEYLFQYPNFNVQLFYDYYIGNEPNKTGLQRISKGYYKPDYIIKVQYNDMVNIYILDSKYSSYHTVKNNHSLKCVKSYILDTAISYHSSRKAEELILLYPGEHANTLYGNEQFKPKISMIPSKVHMTALKDFVESIFPNVTIDRQHFGL